MELLFEFLLELLIEGGIKAGKNNQISKYIRYPLLAILVIIFSGIIGILFFTGFSLIRKNIMTGIVLLLFGLFMFTACIVYIIKNYKIQEKPRF